MLFLFLISSISADREKSSTDEDPDEFSVVIKSTLLNSEIQRDLLFESSLIADLTQELQFRGFKVYSDVNIDTDEEGVGAREIQIEISYQKKFLAPTSIAISAQKSGSGETLLVRSYEVASDQRPIGLFKDLANDLILALSDEGFGLIDIVSTPAGDVYIDGDLIGRSPLEGVRASPGEHSLRVVVDNNRSVESSISVEAAKKKLIEIEVPGEPIFFTELSISPFLLSNIPRLAFALNLYYGVHRDLRIGLQLRGQSDGYSASYEYKDGLKGPQDDSPPTILQERIDLGLAVLALFVPGEGIVVPRIEAALGALRYTSTEISGWMMFARAAGGVHILKDSFVDLSVTLGGYISTAQPFIQSVSVGLWDASNELEAELWSFGLTMSVGAGFGL